MGRKWGSMSSIAPMGPWDLKDLLDGGIKTACMQSSACLVKFLVRWAWASGGCGVGDRMVGWVGRSGLGGE